jgi:putative membrane protein
MMGLLIRWIVNAGALWLIAYVIKGIEVQGFLAALIASAVLGIINAVLRPIFILLTLPINLLTLGLFTFILNGFMLYLAGTLVRGFAVHGFWAAVFGALILSIISALTTAFLSDDGRVRRIHVHIERP